LNYRCTRCGVEVTNLAHHYERVHQGQIMGPSDDRQIPMDLYPKPVPPSKKEEAPHE